MTRKVYTPEKLHAARRVRSKGALGYGLQMMVNSGN
jgi:hypothetical protein